jgi:hypothetical protein
MYQQIVSSLQYFNNPLAKDASAVLEAMTDFRTSYKELAEKRSNPSERSAASDNSSVPVVGAQDMMAMFAQFQRMIEAQKNGDMVTASSANTSITQLQDGVLHAQGDKVAA